MPGVDLLRATYVAHTFARHTHPTYALGVIEVGAERFAYRGAGHYATPGDVLLLNPDEVHDGRSAAEGGWAYRMIYPDPAVLAGIAAELTRQRGTPHFPDAVVADPAGARLVAAASRAAEHGDPLTASTLARTAFADLIRKHGASAPPRPVVGAGSRAAARARDLLHERLADPPALEDLAAAVGARPFALLRAFRREYGLPPHAYLIQLRMRAATRLLRDGVAPVDVAARLGFSDQAHLTRHFKRYVGVPPAAYARERRNVQDRGARRG